MNDVGSGGNFRLELVTPEKSELIGVWQEIHNQIVPSDQLLIAEVSKRSAINQMHIGFLDDQPVACSTIRPPIDDSVVVIVRVLPGFRNAGIGTKVYARLLHHEWVENAITIETVILKTNTPGLVFAQHRGFQIIDEYEIDGAEYVDLQLTRSEN